MGAGDRWRHQPSLNMAADYVPKVVESLPPTQSQLRNQLRQVCLRRLFFSHSSHVRELDLGRS